MCSAIHDITTGLRRYPPPARRRHLSPRRQATAPDLLPARQQGLTSGGPFAGLGATRYAVSLPGGTAGIGSLRKSDEHERAREVRHGTQGNHCRAAPGPRSAGSRPAILGRTGQATRALLQRFGLLSRSSRAATRDPRRARRGYARPHAWSQFQLGTADVGELGLRSL